MKLIEVTSDPYQKQSIATEEGPTIKLEIYFMPLQLMWCIAYLEYDGFIARNIRISNHLNILNQFSNILPFGISCQSDDNREPTLQEDFSSGKSRLLLLDQSEIDQVGEFLNGN